MCKCVFCKKYSVANLYRCEITGQIFKEECFGYTASQLKKHPAWRNDCQHFTASLSDRFWTWIDSL